MAKQNICFLPLVGSLLVGVGFGLLNGQWAADILIAVGVGAVILAVTHKQELLAMWNKK
ncbi:hypothetical protein GOV04_05220 [Candidatus Woesearchaeota archaeon]|nr:hypothetical protein [Candidatus Woesearchaeota archaeon]